MKWRDRLFIGVLTCYILTCLLLVLNIGDPVGYLNYYSFGMHTTHDHANPRGVIMQHSYQNETRHSTTIKLNTTTANHKIGGTTPAIIKIKPHGKLKKALKKEEYDILKYKGTEYCEGHLTSYNDVFFSLKDVIVDASLAKATMKGGEDPVKLLGKTKDEDEFYEYRKGIFTVPCLNEHMDIKPFTVKFTAHHVEWMTATRFSRQNSAATQEDLVVKSRPTLAMIRYEFANVFWVLQDIYIAFLTAKYMNTSLGEVDLVLFDAHPKTPLDALYYKLPHSTQLFSQNSQLTRYEHLIWPFTRLYSPLLNPDKTSSPPYLSEFRKYILERFNVSSAPRNVTLCGASGAGKFNVLFPWRHDYVAHPRNPSGLVSRKISNEEEILASVTATLSDRVQVQGVQLDSLTIDRQLQLISQTDVMIGMHGAAFAYSVFLPDHAAVIELYPKGAQMNWHMRNLAEWRGHSYKNVACKTPQDKTKSTNINPDIIIDLIKEATTKICARLHS